jgi:hypothetical protein
MADDNSVDIRFGASTDDAIAGIQQIRSALSGLTAPISDVNSNIARLNAAFSNALPADTLDDAAKQFKEVGSQAQASASQIGTVNGQMRVMQSQLAQQKVLLNAEATQFQITQNQKFSMLEAETENEYQLQVSLLRRQSGLFDQNSDQYRRMQDKIALLEVKHNTDMIKLDEQAIAQQQQMWTTSLSSIENAFNSQLRGLLAGTTSWSSAFKSILGDVVIKFIEMCETMVVKWVAAQLAQTTAATTGAATRTAAEQTASSAGVLANAANAMQAILTDAAQTFGGVFAFLSPTMGPAAAGPAAAAQASVAAAAVFDVGTDYVVRGGLALIHAGETVVPAARGNGPFTGAATGAQVSAPVSINISALDSQSVARFFNDNSKHMLRAINDAVKRGAHIGLRAINR